jgi:acetylornithine deacetylase/succinyl-diaminopimelate desuccinylase-like protein
MSTIPDGFIADLMALLEIPGVAAWKHGRGDLDRAAAWLRARLERAGLQAWLLDDDQASPPFVYAQTEIRPERPTLLLYGHYDVQPASIEDGWTSDPFKPDIRNGRIYARGATDQKMNLLLPIFALEEVEHPRLPFNIKVFYEGQEEIFSPGLEAALLKYKDLLRSDAVFSTDGWQSDPSLGDLRMGLRGFCGLEIEIYGAGKDLHSGTFGGAVPNPAHALARALSRLHDDDGMIAVPGFNEAAVPLAEAEKTFLLEQPFDRKAWLAVTGLTEDDTPDRLELQARIGLRPTIEINALEAGNYPAGLRTIVPASARARISCRLVDGQDPDAIGALVADFIDQAIPKQFSRQIRPLPGKSHPYRIGADDPFQRLAAKVLADVDGQVPRFTYSGGSIPMPGAIELVLGTKTIIFGFGLPDENMHGVDEFCRLTDIERGMAAWRLLLCYVR